ncbi:hypothetical protein RHMOL_Rhmol02G0197500 [Rhododendron molle]|uniref:Uncharacterized protein n=1 Tax=Rhododendron molle TaxID=49168 RepID=A0ACC0PRU1_RHOML|nr:hypothetical protein RHMOL_Rhmol02G0197500 [Rhododendron molle]
MGLMVWLVTRVSKNKVEELEELEKQKESFYGLERHKMERFQAQVENFVVHCQMQVQELRNKINELKAIFVEVKANNEHLNGSEIAAAEMRKSELSAANYQIRTQLQKQFYSLFLEKKTKRALPVE